jgi:hypothetical protein
VSDLIQEETDNDLLEKSAKQLEPTEGGACFTLPLTHDVFVAASQLKHKRQIEQRYRYHTALETVKNTWQAQA